MTATSVGSHQPRYTPPTTTAPRTRIASLDVVRGVVMILMAIDHVRVYAGVPAGGLPPSVFFTRWVTHFVAPAFVFLAGTSIYLHGEKLGDRGKLSRFLVTRGLWLVLLELTVLRVAWTFNFDFAHYELAGVLWMIGWCMVLMAASVRLPLLLNAVTGVAIIALHNVTDLVGLPAAPGGALSWLWSIVYLGGPVTISGHRTPLIVLFVIVPWIGVMMSGYALGAVMRLDPERRRAICLRLGVSMTLAFVALRALDVYGDPQRWHASQLPGVLAFLATTKYPASLLFLLMTLGPMLIGIAAAERMNGRAGGIVATFGRVPFFYYMLHIPLIHLAACVVSLARVGQVDPWLFTNHPMAPPPVPPGYRWSLPLLYLVFAICVTILYFPCRWFARVRARRSAWWLSYL